MQKLIIKPFFILFFLFISCDVFSQSGGVTDYEIGSICQKLVNQIPSDSKIKHLAISDFTTVNLEPTNFGKHLSEEFAFSITTIKTNFSVIDRSKLKALFKEIDMDAQGLLDPITASELGKLKGVDAILYGTFIDAGDYFTLIVKVLHLESGEILNAIKGRITKTPSIQIASGS